MSQGPSLDARIDALLERETLGRAYLDVVHGPLTRLAADVAAAHGRHGAPLVTGLCGAQGSGKSTTAAFLALLLEAHGLRSAVLSIDDLYWPRADREQLAARVHPMLAVRGVPGTHDVDLGLRVIDALTAADDGATTQLPRFDKGADTRAAPTDADVHHGRADIVIFEGWCVGARPQDEAALGAPVNTLEETRDPDGIWRRHVNAALSGPYQDLFGRIGLLVMLAAPDFECVLAWRTEQERKLRARTPPGSSSRVMSDEEVAVFIQHYERLTRHILAEMPKRCDIRLALNETRDIVDYAARSPA